MRLAVAIKMLPTVIRLAPDLLSCGCPFPVVEFEPAPAPPVAAAAAQ